MSEQGYTPEVTSDDKLWALLSWLLAPIVPIIVLLMEDKKSRPFIKYHAMNGLAWAVVYGVLSAVLSFIFVGCIIAVVGAIAAIYWGIKAYQGEMVKVPVLTDFLKNQGWI